MAHSSMLHSSAIIPAIKFPPHTRIRSAAGSHKQNRLHARYQRARSASIAMKGCIESLYEDWAGQAELPLDALALENFLMPSVSELSQDNIELPSFRSPGRVSPLMACPMKMEAIPCTPSFLLVPQQQSISAGSTESERDESGDDDCAGMARSSPPAPGLMLPRTAGGKSGSHKSVSKRSRLEFEASMTGVLQPFDAVKNYGTGRLSLQQLNAKIKNLCSQA